MHTVVNWKHACLCVALTRVCGCAATVTFPEGDAAVGDAAGDSIAADEQQDAQIDAAGASIILLTVSADAGGSSLPLFVRGTLTLAGTAPTYTEERVGGCVVRTFPEVWASAGDMTVGSSLATVPVPRNSSNEYLLVRSPPLAQVGTPVSVQLAGDAFPAFASSIVIPPAIVLNSPTATPDDAGLSYLQPRGSPIAVSWVGSPPYVRVRLGTPFGTAPPHVVATCDFDGAAGSGVVQSAVVRRVFALTGGAESLLLVVGAASIRRLAVGGHGVDIDAEQLALEVSVFP